MKLVTGYINYIIVKYQIRIFFKKIMINQLTSITFVNKKTLCQKMKINNTKF